MSLDAHVHELRKKHEALAREIEHKQRRPASDDLEITEMKRKKLLLKDEIARLSHA
ncbi:MAG: DUF465 domain-containing protein [Pseudomonadota bacterium]